MTPPGVLTLWLRAALYLLLLLPACRSICPRSCSCTNPKEVHCTFRHLSSPPRNLPKDTVRVNLGYNSIGAVDGSNFENLRQLEMLMLHGNDISSVTSGSFYNLRSLQILKLSYNKLKSVDPGMFEGLSSLVRLYLDHNVISFIEPFSFNGLTSLKLLQLEGNKLQDLHPHTFTTFSFLGTFWGSSLRHLHLADNQLEYLLPATLQHTSKLEVLTLYGNPWTCDCQLIWILDWDKKHEGVIKCKKERDSGTAESCAVCTSPQSLNNSQILQLSAQQLSCDRPSIQSPLKLRESTLFEEQEPDVPYTKDLEQPLGNLALMLSDSHGNRAHVSCDVNHPSDASSMVWEKSRRSEDLMVNVTVLTQLECEIDRDTLQNLWRLVAYYYESPAILEQGARHDNTSKVTFQYSQVASENSPYFTELKGYLMAEPAWLLQPKVTFQLNRRKTTSKKLVLNFSTFISQQISGRGKQEDTGLAWAWIPRGTPGRIQIVSEHSEVILDCNILSSGHQLVEWMLPDLTTLDKSHSEGIISDHNQLVIKNASLADSGIYHCFVRTKRELDMVSFRLLIRQHDRSRSDLNGKKILVKNGEPVHLPCFVSSTQPVEVKWFLPNNHIMEASGAKERIYVSDNNTLIIQKVTYDDAGEYSCSAANLHGVDMLSHLVTVTGEKVKDAKDVTVVSGETHLYNNEEIEGSGYQEIKQPTATETPQVLLGKNRGSGGLYRKGFKGKKVKDDKVKPNKSVKELDPGRWAQMFSKANAKVSVGAPTSSLALTTSIVPTMWIFTTTTMSPPSSVDLPTSHTPEQREHPYQNTDSSVSRVNVAYRPSTTSPVNLHLQRGSRPENQERYTPSENRRGHFNRSPHPGRRPTFIRRPPLRRLHPQRPTRRPPVTSEVTLTTPYSRSHTEFIRFPDPVQPTNAFSEGNMRDGDIKKKHDAEDKDAMRETHTQYGKEPTFQDPFRQTGTVSLAPTMPATTENKDLPEFNSEIYSKSSVTVTNPDEKMISTISPFIPMIKPSITLKEPMTTQRPVLTYNRHKVNFDLPVHPWLNQKNQAPVTLKPNTSFWTYTKRKSFQQKDHTSRRHPSLDRTWHSVHQSGRATAFTNKPEITADTANPTANMELPATTPLLRTLAPQGNSQAMDYLLYSRLRNRYRQTQLNIHRLAPQGKLVSPKPRTYQAQPTANLNYPSNFPSISKPMTPPSIVATTTKPPFTSSILQGNRWHYSRIGSQILSTALPFPKIMGNGVKPRIIPESFTVSAPAEANVLMQCQASGDPKPLISWTKVSTGATIQASTKHGQRFEVLANGTFMIRNVQLQDRGQYLCNAQNNFGSDRTVITLTVQTEPPKIKGPKYQEVSVYMGKSINLDCLAVGKPQAQVTWILPNRSFVRDVTPLGRPIALFPNGTLSIGFTNFSNKGDYRCIASNAVGADTLTYHLHVAVLPPAINEEAFESIPIDPGRSVYVHCTAKGEPEPLLKWVLPDSSQLKPTQFVGRRLFIFPNGTLYINSIMATDVGRYECMASNMVGFAQRVVTLAIRQETSKPWKGLSQQHSVSALYGSTVFLHCPMSDSYRGTVWRLPSKTILDHRYSPLRHITAFPNGTLKVLRLTDKDEGSYLCMFQRPNGEDMELFQLRVLMEPPKIENIGSSQKRVANGDTFLVDCVASGVPNPEVSWSLPDGTVINNALQSDDSGTRSRRYTIFENGTLLLQQMEKSDEGDYTCYAKNTLGEDAMKVSIQVVPNSPQISFKNQMSLRAPLGHSVQMKCEAKGEPPPTIIWISPNNEIITSTSFKYQILNDGTLIVGKVTLEDQGKYTCVARNIAGDDIKNVKLQVDVREPHIDGKSGRSTSRVLAVSYQTILLHCEADGLPRPQIVWRTPYGMSLPVPYVGGRFQVHMNGTLEIRGIRKTDEGQFRCTAKNDLGEASLEVELEVASLAEKPSFLVANIEVLPLKTDTNVMTLNCQALGKPKPEMVWILPNGTVLPSGKKLQRFSHLTNGTLHILKPLPIEKGVYRCLAKNVAGQAEKRYSLELGRKPVIRGTGAPMKISFGQTVNMPCTVEGWPQATITWTLPNGLVIDRPQVIGRTSFLPNGTLQLRETAKTDRGTYLCKATNTFGSSMLSYPVIIMVFPPQITNAPPSITRVTKGSPVILKCVATGIPKPDISWTLPGRTTLVPHNRYTMSGIYMTEDGSLVIQDPSLMNSGIYKCNARNALGTDFKATYLQVI